MDDAIYKFKRYEDASLAYVGIDRHTGEAVGLFDTVLSSSDYQRKLHPSPLAWFKKNSVLCR